MLSDLRFGFRVLRKSPGFWLAAALMLGLGIAANCAFFSVAYAVLYRPLPYRNPGELLQVFYGEKGGQATRSPFMDDFFDWRDRNRVFEDMGMVQRTFGAVRIDDQPEYLRSYSCTANLFSLLGVEPLLGRTFSTEEGTPGRNDVVVLGHAYWRERFHEDPNILGKEIGLWDGSRFVTKVVIGVLPPEFKFTYPEGVHAWIPIPEIRTRPSYSVGDAIARLKPGVTPDQAAAGMRSVLSTLAQEYPETNRVRTEVRLVPLLHGTVGRYKTTIYLLFGATTFLLLIGCVTTANLLLARLTGRERDTAVRAALGASRSRLVSQTLWECLMISIAAAGFGLLISWLGLDLLLVLLPPEWPRGDEVRIDGNVVAFTLVLSLLTTLLFGLIPALKYSRVNIIRDLNCASAQTGAGRGRRFRSALVASEIALSVVLLWGAGLMLNSLFRLMKVDPGFDPENVHLVKTEGFQRYEISDRKDATAQARAMIARRFTQMEAIQSAPGVLHTGAALNPPLAGLQAVSPIKFLDQSPRMIASNFVLGDFFRVLKIPLISGRVYTPQENELNAPGVVVNESLARLIVPDARAVGHRLAVRAGRRWESWPVIGVVADSRLNLQLPPEPTVYVATSGVGLPLTFVVRSRKSAENHIRESLRKAVQAVEPNGVIEISSLEEAVAGQSMHLRFLTILTSGAGLLGLLLGATGVFSITAYTVRRQAVEFGIRIAMGAVPRDVMRIVLRDNSCMAAIGAAFGIAVILALGRVLRSILFEVAPHDPLTLVLVVVVLGAVTFIASYIPARRILDMDPVAALRSE